MIHIYCGDGKGKTTCAIGLAIRMLGASKKVLFAQFFKDGSSSEIEILRSFDNLKYICANSPTIKRFVNMTDEEKTKANSYYRELLQDVIQKSKDYDLIVLDEISSTLNYNMVDKDILLDFLNTNKSTKEIVLTGRNPNKKLIELADYISEIKKVKHPFDNGIMARKGIEY